MMGTMFSAAERLWEISRMKADYHTHTNFSTDADRESSPEVMIQGAIKRGLETICITDHMDKDYDAEGKGFVFDIEKYFETLQSLREKYKEKIHIRIGVELGLQPHLGQFAKEYVNAHPFDFVIGSTHMLRGRDPYYRANFEELTDRELYRGMFEETLTNIKNIEEFDVMGHLDYIVRYGLEQEKSYSYDENKDLIDEILKHLVENGKGLELNTAGLKYGLSFAHPYPAVLKRYRELGGEIVTVGSDGHKPEHIAYDFHKVENILLDCGFKYYTEFRQRKPIFKQVR